MNFRISKKEGGSEYFSYINKMSIKRANSILQKSSFELEYYSEEPLRNFFKYPARLPIFKEFLVKMVVCILKKGDSTPVPLS